MERINTITDNFFKEGLVISSVPDEEQFSSVWTDISGIMSEAFFVLDFQKRNFLYVSPHILFTCGYTTEKIKEEGYEFFETIIHPDDLPLWINIHNTILRNLYNKELPVERIKFFGCTLRIKSFLSDEETKPDYLNVYLKIKPKLQQGIPRWGICLLSTAVLHDPGNFCVHYDNHDYSTYSFISRKWKFHSFVPLSKREKQILVLGQQGLTNKEIADKLCISDKVVEQTKTSLLMEQNLKSFSKKIQYTNNRCLVYQSPVI